MIRRIALAVVAGLALLLTIDLERVWLSPCQPENVGEGQPRNDSPDKNSYACRSIIGSALRTSVDFIDDKHDFVTAGATVVIAFFTIVLAWATDRQARLTRTAINQARDDFKLARAEFVATHRPKLILRGAFAPITDPLEAKIAVTYTITNIGGTRCWMTKCHLGLELVTYAGYPMLMLTPEMSFPSSVPFIGAIAAGESKVLTFVDPVRVWDDNHKRNWGSTGLGLHFVGHITYIDEPGSNIMRQTAFRRGYDIDTQRFRRLWDAENEHDYAD